MPERLRLPDGTILDIPDDASAEERAELAKAIDAKFGGETGQASPQGPQSPWATAFGFAEPDYEGEGLEAGIGSLREPPEDDYGTEEGGTILGSAWEGIKSIPRGVRQFGLMAQQGWHGIRTPDEDTDREKELRGRLEDLMMEIDPKYRDANLVHLGMGLGQVGGMIGLGAGATALGAGAGAATAVAGAATMLMGAGEQAGRIAEYEERTGEDVSKAKEIMSLGMGLGIGLSEIAPLGKYARVVGLGRRGSGKVVRKMADDAVDMTWGQIGKSAVRQAGEEALQEGAAGFAQSLTAKAMYDEEAMADAGVNALREALVGGEVGAVTDLMMKMSSRAIANVRGNRGNHALNRRISKRYWERAKRGELTAPEMEELITGPDVAEVEGRHGARLSELMARVEDTEDSYSADNVVEDMADLEEELTIAREDKVHLEELRKSIFELDEGGNILRDEDGAPIRKREFEEVNTRRAAQERERVVEDADTGIITPEKREEKLREIEDRNTNYNREMHTLAAAFAAKEAGIEGRQQQEEEAVIEEEVLDQTPLPEDLGELEAEFAKVKGEIDSGATPRGPELDAKFEYGAQLEGRIEEVKAGLAVEPLVEPTLESAASNQTFPIEEVVDQVEQRIRPLTEDVARETEGEVASERTQYTAQVAPLLASIDKLRSQLKPLADKVAAVFDNKGNKIEEEKWVSKQGQDAELDSKLAGDRSAIATQLEALDTEATEQLEGNLVYPPIYDDQGNVVDYDRTDEGRDSIKIPATTDGKPKKGAVHPVTGERATQDDVRQQRRERREYNSIIKQREELATQFEEAVSPQQKIDRLARQLENAENDLKKRQDGEVVVEDSTVEALDEEGVDVGRYLPGDHKTLESLDKEIDEASEKVIRSKFAQFGIPPKPKVITDAKAHLERVRVSAKKAIRNRPAKRITSGLALLQSEGYLTRRVNTAVDENKARDVRMDTQTEGGNFELEEYLVSQQQRDAYRRLEEIARDPNATLTAAEVTDFMEGIFGHRGLSIKYDPREGGEAVPVPDARVAPRPEPGEGQAYRGIEVVVKEAKGVEREGAERGRVQAQRAIDAIFGMAAIDDTAAAIETEGTDQRPPISWVGLSFGKLVDSRMLDIKRRLGDIKYKLTGTKAEKIFADLLKAKNFKVPKNLFKSKFFTELIRDTLGIADLQSLAYVHPRQQEMAGDFQIEGGPPEAPTFRQRYEESTPSWDSLSTGEQELVLARLLRTDPAIDTTQKGRAKEQQKKRERKDLREGDMGEAKMENAPDQIPEEASSIVEANERIQKYKNIITKAFKKLGLTGITAQFTADVDSMMAQAKDVMVNGAFVVVKDANGKVVMEDGKPKLAMKDGKPIYRPKYEGGAVASLQNYGSRIVFNLSQIVGKYKDAEIETLIKDAVAHEGAHVHYIRDNLTTSDRKALERYGRRDRAVPKEVDSSAHERGLTWREHVAEIYPEKSGDALTEETSVRILDALAQDKIPAARSSGLIGKIKRELQSIFGAVVGSAEEADLLPVLEVFEKIQNVDTMRRRAETRKETGGAQSLQFIERAKPEDAQRLRDAIKNGDPVKIDEAIDIILDSTLEFDDPSLTPIQRLQESLVSELRARTEIDETANIVSPVLNAQAIEAGDIDPESLNAYFRFADGRKPAFRMPASAQEMRLRRFGKSDTLLTDEDVALGDDALDTIVSRSDPAAQQVIEATDAHNIVGKDKDGKPKFLGSREEFRRMMVYTKGEIFRKKFLDKRLAAWKSSKRAWQREIIKYGEALSRLAENSAIAAWRFADNAMNFIPGVMQHGMIVYENGGFKLKKLVARDPKTGKPRLDADGNEIPVKGLYEIFEPLTEMGEVAQNVATKYMAALRIIDIHTKRAEARAKLQALSADPNATPEQIQAARREHQEWQVHYAKVNKDGKFFPIEAAKEYVANIKLADTDMKSAVVKFSDEYADFNYYMIEFAVQSGQLSVERGDLMKSMRYIPFYRDQGWDNTTKMYNTQNEAVEEARRLQSEEAAEDDVPTRGEYLIDKSIEGSFAPINGDLFGSIQRNVQALIRDGMINIATTRSMRDEVVNGTAVEIEYPSERDLERQIYLRQKTGKKKDGTFVVKTERLRNEMQLELDLLDVKIQKLRDAAEVLNADLDERGFSPIEVEAKGISTEIDPDNPTSEISENGIRKVYRVVDPELSLAVMEIGFSPQQAIEDFFGKTLGIKSERVSKGLAKIVVGSSKFLREMVTRSPPFMLKNIIRDSWQASVVYGGGPAMFFKAMRNFVDPTILKRAEERGLGIAVDWQADPSDPTAVDVEHHIKKSKRSVANPLDWGVLLWDALGSGSKRSEVATRMAVYDHAMAKSDGNAAESLFQAIEIINYGRRGSSRFFAVLTSMAPFMNGRIQGLDVVGRTHVGSMDAPGLFLEEGAEIDSGAQRAHRIGVTMARGSLLVMATMMYYFMVKDDEEYKNAREDQKNDWWLIPLGGDKPGIKIPIPFEVGTIYKVIPEQIMRMLSEEEHDIRDVRGEMARQLKSSLLLDLRPQFIRPMIDAWANKDAYQRDDIVPQWMEDTVMASEQYNPYTSMITRLLGDKLSKMPLVKNMDFMSSPMKLEYMLRQYTGTIGGYLLVAGDRVARELMNENVVGTAADFGFDMRTLANLPVIGDLMYDPQKGGGFQEDMYEAVEDMNTLVTTLGQIRESRGHQAARDFENEHKGMFDAKRRLQYFERRMKHYRDERDRLFERSDLSDDDKRRQLFRMFEIRDDMLGEMVKIMGDIRQERGVMEAALGTRP